MLGHVVYLTIHAREDTRGSRQVNDLSRKGPARHGGVRCSIARFIGYARGIYSGLLHSIIFRKINSYNHSDLIKRIAFDYDDYVMNMFMLRD